MRLPVILIQNPPASGVALAEQLVGNLIGRPGLDLTLIDRLDSLGKESTDRMTLEGITVPAAVLDWRDASNLYDALQAIDFNGYRCAHQMDPTPPTEQRSSSRRLFLFDLKQSTDPIAIMQELNRLKDSLAVKTISIGGLTPPSKQATQQSSESVHQAVSTPPPTSPSVPAMDTAPPQGVSRSDDNLDALIDHLDELDV
ncbi:MAG: hypothetical protein CBB71_23390 [Rhodopirellula sp. TMED11]|nr:MAG: hypothetical protein CBB71_23390 [Rhodopirellula sp. TMED11]